MNFYPRPPRGGRRATEVWMFLAEGVFLSTPSARRATVLSDFCNQTIIISIHALREEGDSSVLILRNNLSSISIHALREEGDEADWYNNRAVYCISIHALREEGDRITIAHTALRILFLSTPSARRATIWKTGRVP